jgi:RNA polymerase sigma factor (sigma-70 family)
VNNAICMSDLDWVMQQARRLPVPTKEEQVILGRAIRAWQDHVDGPDGAPAPVRRRGVRALQKLVAGNLRLVAQAVNSVFAGLPTTVVDKNDLMQIGAEGLMKAALKFRPELGYSFSTYSTWWVRQSLQRSRPDRYAIRLPGEVVQMAEKARAIAGGMPVVDLEAIAAQCGTSKRRVSRRRLEVVLNLDGMSRTVSLDAAPRDTDLVGLHDSVGDPNAKEPMEIVEDIHNLNGLEVALAALEPDEREVVMASVVEGKSFGTIARERRQTAKTVRRTRDRGIEKMKMAFNAKPVH